MIYGYYTVVPCTHSLLPSSAEWVRTEDQEQMGVQEQMGPYME